MSIPLTPDLQADLFNAFDPFTPLQVGDKRYIECKSVRGDQDIVKDLGNCIANSNRKTCYLYSGHTGAGKSTELFRLKNFLESRGFRVIYFDADADDIQSTDAQYTDILLACTRHLLQSLQGYGDDKKLMAWVKGRWDELKTLLNTELKFDSVTVQGQISELVKITTTMKAEPSLRQEIRKKLDPHTPQLVDILNEYLDSARKKLPEGIRDIALLVDSLDRISLVIQEDKQSNYEHIFINHAEQLKSLNCHIVYTTPLALLYSKNATFIPNLYDNNPLILPMVMVRKKEGEEYEKGLTQLKRMIDERVKTVSNVSNLSLETEFFKSPEILKGLCLMSGGYVRNLLRLMQGVINSASELPIDTRTVKLVLSKDRMTLKEAVSDHQWPLLAEVADSKTLRQTDDYRQLLFNQCILEYQYLDEEEVDGAEDLENWDDEIGGIQKWCDVHPPIRGIPEFKQALENRKNKSS
ncbi:MAG: hypothetical protein AB4041_16495 [Microcystaceae cyanobacterium]